MGEQRRRRLALIKGGKADVAKAEHHNLKPQQLVSLTCLCTKQLKEEVLKRFELTSRETLPTLSSFLERLLLAGVASFDRAQAEQEARGSLVKLADGTDLAEVARRLEAAKRGDV